MTHQSKKHEKFSVYFSRVNGCYEALQSGKASEGLLDLTGGLTEVYYPPQMKGPELFDVVRQALRNGAFVACNTVRKPILTLHS